MAQSKHTKRALLSSVLAMLVCVAMLIGSTFAWFTDSVTSGNNKIIAGNLDVDLLYRLADGSYLSVEAEEAAENLFTGTLWEPGHVEVINLQVKNLGTLALTYQLTVNVVDEKGSINANGDPFKLSDYIMFAVVDGEFTPESDNPAEQRAEAIEAAEKANPQKISEFNVNENGVLYPTDTEEQTSEQYVTLIVYMPTSVGNAANYKTGETAPEITLGVELFATQVPYEQDSFDENYDANALVKVGSASELADAVAAAQENDIIMLNENIIDDDAVALAIDKNITLLMNGKSLSAVEITFSNAASLTLSGGKTDSVTVNGEGTLELKNMRITATAEGAAAVALGENAKATVVIIGSNTLTGAKDGDGIRVPATAKLDLSGDVLTVTGNAGKEYDSSAAVYQSGTSDFASTGGSGIGNAGETVGTIYIHDMTSLTAEGYGINAFGIGGNVVQPISISDTVIPYVRGGFAYSEFANGNYGKSEPEGGCAIGVGNGAANQTISLSKVTVRKADGGSKAAAIGGQYWAAVTINIENCTLEAITGGNASAAIGGSRFAEEKTDQTITITIADSVITAQGGQYGAGIGSGYDTYCTAGDQAEKCTITITGNSKVAAVGGEYAAGIGTGYHAGGLAGSIASSVDTTGTKAGTGSYKMDQYTGAMDIGFGILDPKRDGKNNDSSIQVGNETITVPTTTADGTSIS